MYFKRFDYDNYDEYLEYIDSFDCDDLHEIDNMMDCDMIGFKKSDVTAYWESCLNPKYHSKKKSQSTTF